MFNFACRSSTQTTAGVGHLRHSHPKCSKCSKCSNTFAYTSTHCSTKRI
jgi:hypothetical protein